MFVILHFFSSFFLLQLIDWCWSSCSVAAGWLWCFVHAHMSWASNQEWPVHLNFVFSHRWLTLMFCSCPDALSQQPGVASASLNLVFSHTHSWLTLMFCRCPEPAARRGQCISESCLWSQLVDFDVLFMPRCPEPATRSECISESCLQSQLVDFDVLFMPRCPEPAAMSGQWISEARLRPQSRLDSKWLKTNIQVIEIKTNL